MMNSRSSPRERLTSSGSVLSDDSEMFDGIDDAAFDVSDPRLLKAVDKAGKEKNMLPLIKEELRLSILSRRNKEGKGEVIVEERKPQVKRTLTPQEKERKLRRQEQNRRAAKKCRKKKKDCEVNVMQAYYSEKDKNDNLSTQVEELKKEKEMLEEVLRRHVSQCTMNQSNIAPIQDNTHLLQFGMCLSPFEAGIPSTPNPDTPNPTTPHTPGQTFSFSPVPFNTSMPEDLYSTTEDDVCPHTDLTWVNTEEIQTAGLPGDYDSNLDGCFGSEFENIDIAPFTSTENTQYPVASQPEMQFASQSEFSEDDNRQLSGLPIPDNTPGNNVTTSGENMTTLSGLEAVLSLLAGETDAYAIHGNMNGNINEISQHGQNLSCTDLHDI
ncbi:transcription factor kayak-like [Ostrea edulis]|uniref:transcription factor kayak-like n=1 Tax=Ostrea edulis TaxID=37623 RepID=UPI0020943F16|nr:transcription factor kayak-like [Ostrea edulis]